MYGSPEPESGVNGTVFGASGAPWSGGLFGTGAFGGGWYPMNPGAGLSAQLKVSDIFSSNLHNAVLDGV